MSGDEEDKDGKKKEKDDVIFDEEKTRQYETFTLYTKAGHQKRVEDERFQPKEQRISLMYNEVPKEIVLEPGETFQSLRYLFSVSFDAELTVDEEFYECKVFLSQFDFDF